MLEFVGSLEPDHEPHGRHDQEQVTSQVKSLSHRNTAPPNVVSGVNANQLADIELGFNYPTANLYVDAQLARGIRVAITNYLPARDHNETWVKGGYIRIDLSPIDFAPRKPRCRRFTVIWCIRGIS